MTVRRWPVTGLLFGVLWVFVSGPVLAPVPVLGSLLLGLAVGLPVAYVFRRLYAAQVDIPRLLRGLPYAVAYVVVFGREVVVANLDIAYRVLHPNVPMEPQVILVPLRVETPLGVTIIANSITLTPGTVTLDHDPDRNALYVHVIDGQRPAAVVDPIRDWEDYALVIFDEPGSPEDPRPGVRVHPPSGPPEPKTLSTWAETDDTEKRE